MTRLFENDDIILEKDEIMNTASLFPKMGTIKVKDIFHSMV